MKNKNNTICLDQSTLLLVEDQNMGSIQKFNST